jgi:hypothetical protein
MNSYRALMSAVINRALEDLKDICHIKVRRNEKMTDGKLESKFYPWLKKKTKIEETWETLGLKEEAPQSTVEAYKEYKKIMKQNRLIGLEL